jgi:hypothetical protein
MIIFASDPEWYDSISCPIETFHQNIIMKDIEGYKHPRQDETGPSFRFIKRLLLFILERLTIRKTGNYERVEVVIVFLYRGSMVCLSQPVAGC